MKKLLTALVLAAFVGSGVAIAQDAATTPAPAPVKKAHKMHKAKMHHAKKMKKEAAAETPVAK